MLGILWTLEEASQVTFGVKLLLDTIVSQVNYNTVSHFGRTNAILLQLLSIRLSYPSKPLSQVSQWYVYLIFSNNFWFLKDSNQVWFMYRH
jgi:hypothetical protein